MLCVNQITGFRSPNEMQCLSLQNNQFNSIYKCYTRDIVSLFCDRLVEQNIYISVEQNIYVKE